MTMSNEFHETEIEQPKATMKEDSIATSHADFEASLDIDDPYVPLPAQTSERVMRGFSVGLPSPLTVEQIQLRNTLLLSHEKNGVRSVLLSGLNQGAGTTSVALAMATALSSDKKTSVLLVDANFDRPGLHRIFGTPETPGLISVLRDGASLDDVAVFPGTPQLVVVSAGKPVPGTTLDHKRLAVAIAEVRDSFSFILVDTAPVNTHSDVLLLSSYLDCVALVVEAERTQRHTLREAINELNRVQARLLGVVLNRQKNHLPRSIVKM